MTHIHAAPIPPADAADPPGTRRRERLRRFAAVTASAAIAIGAAFTATVPTTTPAAAAPPVPSPVVDASNAEGDVVLNLFQWTWNSVAAECESTIGPAGFGYVKVSPPQEHIQGDAWWTSYQPVSYKLESKLGTRAEFENMVDTCKSSGVGVIVDAVINHMTGADTGSGTGTGGTTYSVDNFPGVPYGQNDFNDCRTNIENYRDRYEVQNCRLLSLQDLRTSSDYVQDKIAGYMNDLIGMGVSGFRIDAAKHIPAADLEAIKAKLTDPNIYWVHEVIGAQGEPIQPSEYLGSGDAHEFDYARELKSRFDGQIKDLRSIGDGKLPSDKAGVFVNNHDTERNGETMNYKFGAKYILANTFMLSWPYGSPTVYSGYAWDDKDAGAPGANADSVPDPNCSSSAWICTQRWTEIAGMVGFHNAVAGTEVTNWWDDGGNHIAYGRGDKGYVSINNTASSVTRTYQTSLPAGTYCDVIASIDCSEKYTVNAAGEFTATLPAYGALALHTGDEEPQCTDDTQAPTVPGSVDAQPNGTSLDVTWSASTDDCAQPITYEVSATADGATVKKTSTETSARVDGLKANTSYSVTVTAIDGSAANNRSDASDAVSATTGSAETADGTEVFYPTDRGWSDYYVHYKVGSGAWTTAPGAAMTPACDGWVSYEIDTGDATTVTAAFNDGHGTWDNNGGKDFTLDGGAVRIETGQVAPGSPCVPVTDGEAGDTTKVTSYYATTENWDNYNIHYRVGTGAWTDVPGVAMDKACEGWVKKEIALDGADGATAVFTNGSGSWDNNASRDYRLPSGASAVLDGKIIVGSPCPTDPADPTDPTDPTDPGTPADGPFYMTNPSGQTGVAASITTDGTADEWTDDMIVAQGVANDDPRIFRGSHEGPVYDLYSLSAAWDDDNLYLMWQMTNVTDVVDPAQGYPTSDNGKPYQGDIPFSIAFDTVASLGTDGLIDGTDEGVWGIRNTFVNDNVDHLAMFSAKPGVGEPAVFSMNDAGVFDYEKENVLGFEDGDITFAYDDGFAGGSMMGISANGSEGYTPTDLLDDGKYIDFLSTGHSTAQDTTYEMKIPLASIGTTRAELESAGIGVQLISTFGQSGIGSLPHDPAVLDNATEEYSADPSTSAEKEDVDEFSVPLARIGK